jgi:hypothetical protein
MIQFESQCYCGITVESITKTREVQKREGRSTFLLSAPKIIFEVTDIILTSQFHSQLSSGKSKCTGLGEDKV